MKLEKVHIMSNEEETVFDNMYTLVSSGESIAISDDKKVFRFSAVLKDFTFFGNYVFDGMLVESELQEMIINYVSGGNPLVNKKEVLVHFQDELMHDVAECYFRVGYLKDNPFLATYFGNKKPSQTIIHTKLFVIIFAFQVCGFDLRVLFFVVLSILLDHLLRMFTAGLTFNFKAYPNLISDRTINGLRWLSIIIVCIISFLIFH